MHELAICQALISQVEEVVRERSARVKRVSRRNWTAVGS